MSYYGFRRFNRYASNSNNNPLPPGTNSRIDDPAIKTRLETLMANPDVKANSSTLSFMQSLLNQFNSKGFLSQKQFDCIAQNESKYDSNIQSAKNAEFEIWSKEYDQEKRQNAIRISNFYKNQHETSQGRIPFYYQKTAERVLADANYIPSREAYDKLVNNKYSSRLLTNTAEGPKYKAGDFVCLSKTGVVKWHDKIPDGAFVIHVGEPKRVVAGGYVVTVLPVGTDRTMEFEERWLKLGKL